jgi:hypothetical protein
MLEGTVRNNTLTRCDLFLAHRGVLQIAHHDPVNMPSELGGCAIAGCTRQAERLFQAVAVAQLRARSIDGFPDSCPEGGLPICYQHRGAFAVVATTRALASADAPCCSCGETKVQRLMEKAKLSAGYAAILGVVTDDRTVCIACKKKAKAEQSKRKRTALRDCTSECSSPQRPGVSKQSAGLLRNEIATLRTQNKRLVRENERLGAENGGVEAEVKKALKFKQSARGFKGGGRTSKQRFTEHVVTQIEMLCADSTDEYDLTTTLTKRPRIDIDNALRSIILHPRVSDQLGAVLRENGYVKRGEIQPQVVSKISLEVLMVRISYCQYLSKCGCSL